MQWGTKQLQKQDEIKKNLETVACCQNFVNRILQLQFAGREQRGNQMDRKRGGWLTRISLLELVLSGKVLCLTTFSSRAAKMKNKNRWKFPVKSSRSWSWSWNWSSRSSTNSNRNRSNLQPLDLTALATQFEGGGRGGATSDPKWKATVCEKTDKPDCKHINLKRCKGSKWR